jgi:hypothetical protein
MKIMRMKMMRKMEGGRWREEDGGRKMEGGRWREEDGGRKMEGGRWREEDWAAQYFLYCAALVDTVSNDL